MRLSVLVLVLVAAPVAGQGEPVKFPVALRVFELEVPTAFQPGASARVFAALESLLATGDARAVLPLGALLAATIREEQRIHERVEAIQKSGAGSHDRIEEIDEELEVLERRAKSGAAEVGPRIAQLQEERAQNVAAFELVQLQVADQSRLGEYVVDLRERIVVGLIALVKEQDAKALRAAVRGLRRQLDVTNRVESLVLVRILRASDRAETIPVLIDVFESPSTHRAAADAAIAATGALVRTNKNVTGARALIQLWRRQPAEGARNLAELIRAVLSLAAGKRLDSPAAAEAWAKTLVKEPAKGD